jgi:hypothetical protein
MNLVIGLPAITLDIEEEVTTGRRPTQALKDSYVGSLPTKHL